MKVPSNQALQRTVLALRARPAAERRRWASHMRLSALLLFMSICSPVSAECPRWLAHLPPVGFVSLEFVGDCSIAKPALRVRWHRGEGSIRDAKAKAFESECKGTFGNDGALHAFSCMASGQTPLAGASYKRVSETGECDMGGDYSVDNFECTAGCGAVAPQLLRGQVTCYGGPE